VARINRVLSRRILQMIQKLKSQFLPILLEINVLDSVLSKYFRSSKNFITWDYFSFDDGEPCAHQDMATSNPYLQRKIQSTNSERRQINPFGSNLAIVLQGPIIAEGELTLKIAKNYRARYPDAQMILSTWESTSARYLQAFREMDEKGYLKLILNAEPQTETVFNLNHQISSSIAGLNAALGNQEFAIKTRTDQLFANPLFLKHLETVWREYGEDSTGLERIVISSLNTFAFRLYGASDMFQFGKTKTLTEFWNQDHDFRSKSEIANSSPTLHAEALKRVAEVYLNSNYFEKIKHQAAAFDFEESLKFLSDYFVVIDQESASQLWFKNTHLSNRWRSSNFPNKYYEISHLDWLEMQKDLSRWLDYEDLILDESFYHET